MARGKSIKLALGRLGSILLVAGGWLLAGFRLVLDLIGYSTIPEDVTVAQTRLDQFLELILSIPWWAVWGFALISTLWLIWVSWPRTQAETILSSPADVDAPKPAYASPFAGKTPAAPETIPQRFIDIIDEDDRGIDGRIRLHAIPKPIRVHRHLDAPDPYIDISVHLSNTSVFALEYQSAQGRFHFQNHPLQNEPESLNPGVILTRNQAEIIRLRQYVTQNVAQRLQEWAGCEFNITNVHLVFKYRNRLEIEKKAEFKLRGRCHLVDLI